MNAHTPFDAKKDWSNPYCQNSSNDQIVDSLLGNAYHVVRTVYCNLGNLKLLYDLLNQYGMVLGVQSEAELKALTTESKYARIYGFSRAGDRQVTDYLYVEGDRTGILPDDTTATGSWVTVATSGSNSGGTSSGDGAYIPWVYNKGSAIGGETTINVPDYTVGVPFIIINGDMQYVGRGFEFSMDSLSVTLAQPLEEGDEVVFLLTGVPAVPDNPHVNDWVQINWLYNNGAAVGGEQVIAIPYTFQSVPAVYKNGLRLYKGLTTESYTADPDNQRIFLTEPLATNDRLIVQIGGEAQVLEASDRTLQEVARAANVKDSEVILSTDTTQVLNGKKVIYDVVSQRIYGLPTLPTNVYINTVSNGQLTYSPGNITVTLEAGILAATIRAESLVDLLNVPFFSGCGYFNFGFYPGSTVGGGSWKAVSNADLTQNNGGTFVSKASLQAWYDAAVADGGATTENLQANLDVLLEAGVGTGDAFVRTGWMEVDASCFGILPTYDITYAFNKLLKTCDSEKISAVFSISGQYIVSDEIDFRDLSGFSIRLSPGVKFKAAAGSFANYASSGFFTFSNTESVHFSGDLVIEMNKEEYTTGESRHGLRFRSVKDLKFDDVYITGTGGDGIFMGSFSGVDRIPCEGMRFGTIYTDNARRNGVAFVNVKDFHAKKIITKNTIGTNPEAGVDFEPNVPAECLQDIYIDEIVSLGNAGSGVDFAIGTLKDTTNRINIQIGSINTDGRVRFALNTSETLTQKQPGIIKIGKVNTFQTRNEGVRWQTWSEYGVNVIIDDCLVYEPCQEAGATVYLNSAIVSYTNSDTPQPISGGFTIKNLEVIKGTSPNLKYLCYLGGFAPIKSVRIDHLETDDPTLPTVIDSVSGHINAENIIVVESVSVNIKNYAGKTITAGGVGSRLFTLPTAAGLDGIEYNFLVSSNSLSVQTASSDLIYGLGYAPTNRITSRKEGSFIKLKSMNGKWYVKQKTLDWSRGTSEQFDAAMTEGASSPTAGAWNSGDICWNNAPATSEFAGWICTVSGEFGTATEPVFRGFGVIGSTP